MNKRRRGINFWILKYLLWTLLIVGAAFPGGPGDGPARAAAPRAGDGRPDLSRAEWLLLGPLPNPATFDNECAGFAKDYLTDLGGEAGAHPRPGLKSGAWQWQSCRADQGGINFANIFGPAQQAVAYAYTEFQIGRPQAAALKLGSDDGVKVWLNGRLVWQNHRHRSLCVDSDAVPVKLQAGTNRLLLKVDQGNGDWGFCARFGDPAAEWRDWLQTPRPEYQFILERNFVPAGGRIRGYAVTVPAYAVAEKIRIDVSDVSGKVIRSQTAQTGMLVSLPLPRDYRGECRIGIAGTGPRARITAAPVSIFCGGLAACKRDMAAKARRLACRLADTGQAADPRATLRFLANQLEGKVHASLCTTDRTIRAMQMINDLERKVNEITKRHPNRASIRWPAGSFTGIRQWAYRSAIDNSYQPYSLYLPPGYDPARKYSLLICLHGYSGDDYGALSQALTGARPDDFIVAAPFGRGDMAYRSLGEQDVLDLMELAQHTYAIDPDRIYLTGWSMGGCGAWRIGQLYADRFAAVVPFCGWTSTDYLENLRNTPVLIVHGDSDPTVPAMMDQAAYDRLRDFGYSVRYDELRGAGHDVWSAWIQRQGRGAAILYEYLRRFRRNPWPDRVVAAAAHLRYGKEFWVQMMELAKPLTKGVVAAEIVDRRHLRVNTANVKTFALNLLHPKLARSGRILLDINGSGLAVDAGQQACALELVPGEQRFVRLKKDANSPGPATTDRRAVVRHDGGGLADLFTAPLVIVYDSRQDAALCRKAAKILSDWSAGAFFAGTKVGKFTVKSDQAIRPADLKKVNILFIGSDQTVSRLIPEWYRRTPVDFYYQKVQIGGRNFEKAGLMMVCPNPNAPERLIGLISLPFGEREYLDFIARLQLRLRAYGISNDDTASFTTPDVMVLDSPAKMLWAGSFDCNWRNLRKIDYN